MERKTRNSNIELLRIIAMAMIVAGHFAGQNGFVVSGAALNDYAISLLSSGSRIAVNIFLLIGVWYMVDKPFQVRRILTLWGQVYFYSFLLTAFVLLADRHNISLKDTARGFMPFWGRGLWFASAYITLMLFKPFLDKILLWQKKELRILTALLMVFISFVSTLPDVQDAYVCDSTWFAVVYLLVGYIKRYGNIQVRHPLLLAGGVILYSVLATLRFIGTACAEQGPVFAAVGALSDQYLSDIKTIPNFLCAFLIFMAFIKMRPRSNRAVDQIAGSMFTVYIVHQVPAFYPYLWRNIFRGQVWAQAPSIHYILFVVVCIFFGSIIMDWPRKKWLEPLWERSKIAAWLSARLDGLYPLPAGQPVKPDQ